MERFRPTINDTMRHDRVPGSRVDRFKDVIDQSAFIEEAEAVMDEVYRMNEIVPANRNFDIVARPTEEGGTDLVLVRDDGTELSLTTLLPEGYKFRPGEAYLANLLTKTIYYEPDNLDFREAVLSIAHEIGHAKMKEEGVHNKGHANFLDILRGVFESYLQVFRIKKAEARRGSPSPQIESPREIIARYNGIIPDWFMEKLHNPQARNERGAWARGMVILRDLESEGYEVFAGFNGVRDVFDFVTRCLLSYEMRHELEHYMTGNDDSYKPTFEKKHERLRPDPDSA